MQRHRSAGPRAGRHRAAGARRAWHTAGDYWRIARVASSAGGGLVAANVLCNVALGALPPAFVGATSAMLGRIPAAVGAGTGSAAWRAVMVSFAVAAGCFTAQHVLQPWQSALGDHLANRIDGQMYHRLMAASLRSPGIAPLQDQRLLDHLGEAARELESGYQSPGQACAGLLGLTVRMVQLVACVLVIGVVFSWLAAGCVLAVVLALRHSQRRGQRRYSSAFVTYATDRRRSRYYRQLAIGAAAAKEIRVFGLVDWLAGEFREACLGWLVPVWRQRRRVMLWPHLTYTALGASVMVGVFVSIAANGSQTLTLAGLTMVLQATLMAVRQGEFYTESDMQTLLGMTAYTAIGAFERGVAGHRPRAATTLAPRGVVRPAGAIRFTGVRFRYPGRDSDVFTDLDLTIPAGRCTAIVGVNGTGKTTLVKLLARLHEPACGTITVGGVDIRSFAVDDWRRHLAVVFQEFVRYDMSAADNIGLGAVTQLHRRDRIRFAARQTGIDTYLDGLPRGLDTPLACDVTGGADLSGGQWQRVALARALFAIDRGSSILVLDEPTASLDVRAEARFLDEFARIIRGVTTILISHRFSTVRRADHIVVLEAGHALEQGSHVELVHRGGRYEQLFRRQAERFVDSAGGAA